MKVFLNQFLHLLLPVACLLVFPVACSDPVEPADLVLHQGKIVTMSSGKPAVEAIAVRNGRIFALGTNDEIRPFIGSATEVIDLQEKTAIPGLIEGHAHFVGIGQAKRILDFSKTSSWNEIVEMVRQAAKQRNPGEWILGRGWHQEKWDRIPKPNVDGLPLHQTLSSVSPENPVMLRHASGHASYANSRAMKLAGISPETEDPVGGEIVRDRYGRPMGVFRETAQALISSAYEAHLSQLSEEDRRSALNRTLDLAREECLSKGITSIHDAGASFETIDAYRERASKGTLGVRVYAMLEADDSSLSNLASSYRMIGEGDGFLTVRAIKKYADGALGTHGAWLLEPYSDLAETSGLNVTPMDQIAVTARFAAANGYQLCVHAIGDRANREVLDLYQEVFPRDTDLRNARWRIEHVQHLNPADIPRFGELGVLAVMQGVHATSDGPWVSSRLGDQRVSEGAYVWRGLLDSGAVIVNGTDAPVEDVNPIASFYASVTRCLKDGTMFLPEQAMTRLEALRSYTLDAAFAAFEEKEKGSLEIGKLADITVLSGDILTVPEEEILDISAVYTIVGGKIVYSSQEQVRKGVLQ